MNQCAKCGASTPNGQFYRFYFGVVVDDPESTPTACTTFEARGFEESYYCDGCVIKAISREEMIRSGLYFLVGLFATLVVVLQRLTSGPGLWVSLIALLLVAALGGRAFHQSRRLRRALRANRSDEIRQLISSNRKMQDLGDVWAIARRRSELQKRGAELFLTRSENEFFSTSCNDANGNGKSVR